MATIVIPIVWSMMAGACLALGIIHLAAWIRHVRRLENLAFSVLAFSVAAIAIGELLLMRARTPAEFGEILRWIHIPIFTAIVGFVAFIRTYFGTGRPWLGYGAVGARLLSLILDFHFDPNINYQSIDSLRQVELFGGETVSVVAAGVTNPWIRIAEASSLLLMLFMVDAMLTYWRHGGALERRRAVVVGGSLLLSFGLAAGHGVFLHAGVIHSIYLISIPFLLVVAAISFELSADHARSVRIGEELVKSDAQLRESERRMDLAAEAARMGSWQWDIDRDEIWAPARTRALFGIASAEPLDFNRFLAALRPEDRDAARGAVARSREQGGSYEREYRVALPGGQERWIRTRGSVDVDAAGKAVCMRGISFDITERKERDALLTRERAFLRQVLDIDPSLIFAKDRQGRFTLANRAVADIYGTTVDDIVGKTDADFNRQAEEVEAFRRADVEVMDTLQERFIAEEHITDADGRGHWLQTVKRPILSEDGSANQILGVATDITARKQTDLELGRQRNELAHLSRVTLLSELSGSIAHELNQPLAAILSNAQAALEFMSAADPNLPEVREILEDIVSDDKRAGEVIQGLRLLLRKGEIRREPLDVNEVVRDVLRLVRSDLVHAGVRMTTDFATDLPQVPGDRVQLQQVVLNLILNGCDAMGATAAPSRRLAVSTALADGGGIRVCVADNGPGIAPQDVGRVFEPFFTTKSQGLGLGLAVCRNIIDAHAGRLWAGNNAAGGATFCFTVPAGPVN